MPNYKGKSCKKTISASKKKPVKHKKDPNWHYQERKEAWDKFEDELKEREKQNKFWTEKKREKAVEEVCQRLMQGEVYTRIFDDKHLPKFEVFCSWLAQNETYQVRIDQAQILGTLPVIHQMRNRAYESGEANVSLNADKFYITKTNPRRYGDRTQSNLNVKNEFDDMSKEELKKFIEEERRKLVMSMPKEELLSMIAEKEEDE